MLVLEIKSMLPKRNGHLERETDALVPHRPRGVLYILLKGTNCDYLTVRLKTA